MTKTTMIRVNSDYLRSSGKTKDKIKEVPTSLSYMKGWTLEELLDSCHKKNWIVWLIEADTGHRMQCTGAK